MESASGNRSFINLDSTDSEGGLVVESSLGCMTDCSTSEDCRRGFVNVTSENDQFQSSPAATCAASTRSDEIPEKFHPPSTYKFPNHKFGTFFSKRAFMLRIIVS